MVGKMQNTKYEHGFSLIEVLIATILVGLVVASLIAASGSFTKASGAGMNLSTAEFLLEQVRELAALLPVVDPDTDTSIFGPEESVLADYDDLDDFDGVIFSPPISADRQILNDFSEFSQHITVENVDGSNFGQVVGDHSSYFVRITVDVSLNSKRISSVSWIRARY